MKKITALKTFLTLLALMLATCLGTMSYAVEEKPETPKVLKNGKIVSSEEAKALLDKKGAKFFDMRAAINFGKGHLAGAVALPYKENSEYKADFDASKDGFDLAKLPSDKNTPIVFYSDGPAGWKSYKAAVLAIKSGYKKVMWMREGTKVWEAKKFPLVQ